MLCFELKIRNKYIKNQLKIVIFTAVKNRRILRVHVIVKKQLTGRDFPPTEHVPMLHLTYSKNELALNWSIISCFEFSNGI